MTGTLAVVIAWRKGETELATTVQSAGASAGTDTAGAVIYTVEDKAGEGPARTRHRGIIEAGGADVIAIVDAHMQFEGSVLRDMADQVHREGGLLCAKCYHNPECSFDHQHPGGASYYAGANIEYMSEDGNGPQSLLIKWSSDPKPGPRPWIGGACYVFGRDWYFDVGQPLAALPGWGCDEEALSISAWLSGSMPEVFDGRVAHRWRDRTPWKLTDREALNIKRSRAALVTAVVDDDQDRAELLAWQNSALYESEEVDRWRAALLEQPRKWADWKLEVATMAKKKTTKAKTTAKTKPAPRKARTPATTPMPVKARANYGSAENQRTCRKCGSPASHISGERVTGKMRIRYRICDQCGARRTTKEITS